MDFGIRLMGLVVFAALVSAAAEPAWQAGIFRIGQSYTKKDTRPLAVGNQKTTTMLLDRLITPRSTSSWFGAIEQDDQIIFIQAKNAPNLRVNRSVRFYRDRDKLVLLDDQGKRQKFRVVAQMDAAAVYGDTK